MALVINDFSIPIAGARLHLMGIGGVGMAGLAYLLHERGGEVSGCDQLLNTYTHWLEELGVGVTAGHAPAHLAGVDGLIISSAVAEHEPEVQAARQRGLPVWKRGDVLAQLAREVGVVVCGTHGKTTTTCFLTRLLQELGERPQWCIGGTTRSLATVAGGVQQTTTPCLVVEGDESDGTLAQYRPRVTILTNVDLDHLEHFKEAAALYACFENVLRATQKVVVVGADNARARELTSELSQKVLSYGLTADAELQAKQLQNTPDGITCELFWCGQAYGTLSLRVPGAHNLLNALAAMAGALALGYPLRRIMAVVERACDELPKRRFETIARVDGATFVSDYAHHPAELRATIATARSVTHGRLIVVFQPHRYSRTLALRDEFVTAFTGADEVILLPVFAASEKPMRGGHSYDLYAHLRQQWQGDSETPNAQPLYLAQDFAEVWHHLALTVRATDCVLILGAGDIVQLAQMIQKESQDARRAHHDGALEAALTQVPGARVVVAGSLAAWTKLGVAGAARWTVEVATEAALTAVVRLCQRAQIPWRFFGAGANSWCSDLGYAGCALRWAPGAAQGFERQAMGRVIVGSGWLGAPLLQRLEEEHLSGLEFMEGIPGTCGGWLAMNAGAHGQEVGSMVRWLRCLMADGEIVTLEQQECGFGYRESWALHEAVVLSCCLQLTEGESTAIAARRRAIRQQRLPLAGIRSLGSLFRNPAADYAGRLSEQAQAKGMRVGGAYITPAHGNIMALAEGGTASDALALMLQVRARVEEVCGVCLVPEVRGFKFRGME